MENHCGNLDKKSYIYKKYFHEPNCRIRNCNRICSAASLLQETSFETQILSYEGDFLLKIFRQTGDRRYLELCKDISHNVIQYVNTKTNHVQPGDNVGWNAWYNWPKVHVPAGKSVTVTLPFEE